MSLEQIQTAVENFIFDSHNDLLVIKGKWGAGKTFFWQKLIKENSDKKCVGKDFYSYVSLFGINNLEELKNSILASRVEANNTSKLKLDTLAANLKHLASGLEKVPALREYTGGMIGAFLHLLLDNTLVCFDDLERKGDRISIKDILGLASVLKEQRNCKILIIVNEETLVGELRDHFKIHGEKIIDREVVFSITAEEAFSCVFQPSFHHYELVKECCLKLQVTNIRILQRVKRFIEDIAPYFTRIENKIAESFYRMLILYVWSYYDKESNAPSLDFVLNYSPVHMYLDGKNKTDVSPQDKKWNEIISSYGYLYTDDADRCLADFVKTGYINRPNLITELNKKNEQLQRQVREESYSETWGIYRNSFDDNEQEFVEALVSSSRSNMDIMSLRDLQSVAETLRMLGQDESANILVDEFFNQRNTIEGMKTIKQLQQSGFAHEFKDEYLLSRLHSIWTSKEFDKRSISEVIKAITFKEGWHKDDVVRLDTFVMDDYYNFFKAEKSENLYYYVRKCLDFGDLGDTIYKSVGEKTKNALLKIAAESKINRMRVSTLYKIEIV